MDSPLPTDADLLARIKAFCADKGLAPTTFGREALGDGSLIANMEAGRSLTLRNAARVTEFMANYRAPEPAQAAA